MTDKIMEQNIGSFFDALASSIPAPGGGCVAALNGAMAASLVSMVCAITFDKKKPLEDAEEIRTIHMQAERLRHEFQQLAQADIEVFTHLSAAYKLPRITDADAASRRAAIQKITRDATEIPLKIAHLATDVLPLCAGMVHRCSRMLVSDIGVAVYLAQSTVQAALLNVEINLASLEDHLFVTEARAQMEDLLVGLSEETSRIGEIVQKRIRS